MKNECKIFNTFKNSGSNNMDFKSAIKQFKIKDQGNFFGSFLKDRMNYVNNKFLFYFLMILFFIIHVSF